MAASVIVKYSQWTEKLSPQQNWLSNQHSPEILDVLFLNGTALVTDNIFSKQLRLVLTIIALQEDHYASLLSLHLEMQVIVFLSGVRILTFIYPNKFFDVYHIITFWTCKSW